MLEIPQKYSQRLLSTTPLFQNSSFWSKFTHRLYVRQSLTSQIASHTQNELRNRNHRTRGQLSTLARKITATRCPAARESPASCPHSRLSRVYNTRLSGSRLGIVREVPGRPLAPAVRSLCGSYYTARNETFTRATGNFFAGKRERAPMGAGPAGRGSGI